MKFSHAEQMTELELTILGRKAQLETHRKNARWPADDLERQRNRIEVLEDLLARMKRSEQRGKA